MVGHALAADVTILRVATDLLFGSPDPADSIYAIARRVVWDRSAEHSQELAKRPAVIAVPVFMELARKRSGSVREWFDETERSWKQLVLDVPLRALAREIEEEIEEGKSSSLRELWLRGCVLIDLRLGEVLPVIGGTGEAGIESLGLYNAKVARKVWDDLNGVHNLTSLNVNNSVEIDDVVVDEWCRLTPTPKLDSLRDLKLRGASITTDGIKQLARLRNLETLELRGVKALREVSGESDRALEDLIRSTALICLDLQDTSIDAEGAAKLEQLAPPERKLRVLYSGQPRPASDV
jgi:hypothetical protein